MLAMGDISTNEARRRIDAGYTANNPDALAEEIRRKAISVLPSAFRSDRPGDPQQYEIARLLAMLGADTREAMEIVAAAIATTSHPTHDAHYLFCLAQMPGPREALRADLAAAFLGIDRKLRKARLLTDRNWSVNLKDALQAQLNFDPATASSMAQSGDIPPASAHLLSLLAKDQQSSCLLYTSPSPRDATLSRMPSSA